MQKTLSLILALILCLLLVACGSSSFSAENTSSAGEYIPAETAQSSHEEATEGEYIMSTEDDSLESEVAEIPSVTSSSVLKEGNCGESATFALYDNGVLVISGTGEVLDPFMKFNDYVKFIRIEEGITAIGDNVFKWLENCIIAELPSTLKAIGASSFENCSSLTTVNLPYGLEHVGDSAFYFSGLTSLEVPGTLLSMGESAFALCDISSLIIQDGVPYISQKAFSSIDCEFIVIPGSVKTIGMNAFDTGYSDNPIKIAILCDGVETLEASAFCDTEIIAIPDSVTKIGNLITGIVMTGMDPEIVYCNDGSCAAKEFAREADIIVGYDGFIKNYNLEDYT